MEDPEALARQIGRRIAELRRKARKTQEQLAEELGVGWRYVSRAERGLENLTIGSLAKIATCLQVRVKDLLAELEDTSSAVVKGRPRKTR